jgi:putative mRNA 3-end processing factor
VHAFGALDVVCGRGSEETAGSNCTLRSLLSYGSRSKFGRGRFRVYVSGWEFDSPCRMVADKEYVVALSDHSDFDGLIEYVRRSKPKLVITDNFRVGHARTLAKEIRKR